MKSAIAKGTVEINAVIDFDNEILVEAYERINKLGNTNDAIFQLIKEIGIDNINFMSLDLGHYRIEFYDDADFDGEKEKIEKDGTIRRYDENGNCIYQKESNGNEYHWKYDSNGNKIHCSSDKEDDWTEEETIIPEEEQDMSEYISDEERKKKYAAVFDAYFYKMMFGDSSKLDKLIEEEYDKNSLLRSILKHESKINLSKMTSSEFSEHLDLGLDDFSENEKRRIKKL